MATTKSEYNKEYYAKNKERWKDYYEKNKETLLPKIHERARALYVPHPRKRNMPPNKEYNKLRYHQKRNEFLSMYGNRCNCCGEDTKEFLTIEHIQGQKGKKRETSQTAYGAAIKQYQPEVYEILCYNCNCAKGKYGECPHKIGKRF